MKQRDRQLPKIEFLPLGRQSAEFYGLALFHIADLPPFYAIFYRP